jgi:hypothetical protein
VNFKEQTLEVFFTMKNIILLGTQALLLFSSCSNLQEEKGRKEYTFPGIADLAKNPDGTFTISWEKVPAEGVTYRIFSKPETSPEFDFKQSVAYTNDLKFTTEKLEGKSSVCFLVRFERPATNADVNNNFKCTKTTPYVFDGVSSISETPKGTFSVQWPEFYDAKFSIFERILPEGTSPESAYNFNFAKLAVSGNTFETDTIPLGENRCYVVRASHPVYHSKQNPDLNTKEICTKNLTLGSFSGLKLATSTTTGVAKLEWDLSQSAQVSGYNIYTDPTFTTKKESVSSSVSKLEIKNLSPDEEYFFGVRAFGKNGVEDKNTKTIALTIANTNAPNFAGLSGANLVPGNPRKIRLDWTAPNTPVSKYSVYKGIAAVGAPASGSIINFTTPFLTVSGSFSSVVLENLDDEMSHHFVVRASVSGGAEDTNTIVKAASTLNDGAPKFMGIQGVNFSGGQILAEFSGANGQVSGYNIYASQNALTFSNAELVSTFSAPVFNPLNPNALVSAPINNLANTTSYFIGVRAVDSYGNIDTNTNSVQFLTPNLTPPVFSGIASVLGGVTPASVNLSWNAASATPMPAASYEIYRSEVSGVFNGVPVASVPAVFAQNTYQTTLTNQPDFKTLYYKVKAKSSLGIEDTNTAQLSFFVPDVSAPTFSGISSIQNQAGSQSIALKFSPATDNQNVASYQVFYKIQGSNVAYTPSVVVSQAAACNTNPCVISLNTSNGLVANTSYDFKISASDTNSPANINSSAVVLSHFFPDFTPPANPSNVVLTPSGSTPTNNKFPTVSGTAQAGQTIKMYADGIEVGSQTIMTGTTFNVLGNLSALASGQKGISVRAFNSLGLQSSSIFVGNYALDVSAPTITLNSQLSNPAIGGSASTIQNSSFTFTSNEASNFILTDSTSQVSVQISSGSLVAGSPRNVTVSYSQLLQQDGIHNLVLTVTDAAENSTTQNLSLTVDTTPPLPVQDVILLRDEMLKTQKIFWNNSTLESGSSVTLRKNSSAPVSLAEGTLVANNLNNSVGEYTLNYSEPVPVGYSVFVCDAAGNCSTANTCPSCKANLTTVSTQAVPAAIDRIGESAFFSWSIIRNRSSAKTILAKSESLQSLMAWRGQENGNQPQGVDLFYPRTSDFTASSNECPDYGYCDFNFTSKNYAPWTNVLFRDALIEGGNSVTLRDVKRWAKVPNGMAFVPKEEWPNNEPIAGSSPTQYENYPEDVKFDFAMDLYEVSVNGKTSGSKAYFSGANTYPNSSTDVAVSNGDVPDSGNFYQMKQACLNRSYFSNNASFANTADLPSADRFSIATKNASRKFHLQSTLQFMVGSFGTPTATGDGYCKVNGTTPPTGGYAFSNAGADATYLCKSKFGVFNLIGNVLEYTDAIMINGVKNGWQLNYGTSAQNSFNRTVEIGNGTYNGEYVSLNGLRVASGNNLGTVDFGLDDTGNGGGHGGAIGWGMIKGHGTSSNETGRFYHYHNISPGARWNEFGSRCAIAAPSAKPKFINFRNESNGNNVQLSFNFESYESSSTIRIAKSNSLSDINSYAGEASASNTTVYTNPENCSSFSSSFLHTHKFCEAESTQMYYKVCMQNPLLPHLNPSEQPFVCSQTLAHAPAETVPVFEPVIQASRTNFQNDSVGTTAAFYWKLNDLSNLKYRVLITSVWNDALKWDGEVFNADTHTQTIDYNPSGFGNSEINNTCQNVFGTGLHYAPPVFQSPHSATSPQYSDYFCYNMSSLPKYAKRFFRLAVAKKTTHGVPSQWVLSQTQAAGNVPKGMVLVAKELWPNTENGSVVNEYPAWLPECGRSNEGAPTLDFDLTAAGTSTRARLHNCRYDFAIDKFEPFAVSGTADNTNRFKPSSEVGCDFTGANLNGASSGQNATCLQGASSSVNNTTTTILDAPLNHADALTKTITSLSWYANKKACENRKTLASFTGANSGYLGANVLVQPRMATGVEWIVASAETPDTATGNDDFCRIHTSNTTFISQGSMPKCVSKFGMYDAIGNTFEYTDEISFDKVNFERFYGTPFVYNVLGAVSFPAIGWITGFNYISGFPTSTNTTPNDLDYFNAFTTTPTTSPANGGTSGVGWAIARGGGVSNGTQSGRFFMFTGISPHNTRGTRCSIALP